MARDSQRSKLYKAEKAALVGFPGQRAMGNEAAVQQRVNEIVNSQWMRENASYVVQFGIKATLNPRKRHWASAFPNVRRIEYGSAAMTEWLLIHEIAHIVHHYTANKWDRADHGPQFAEIYLSMVSRFISVAAHDALKASFKKHRVRYKRKKQLSEEQRAALSARLRAMHAKKRAGIDAAQMAHYAEIARAAQARHDAQLAA